MARERSIRQVWLGRRAFVARGWEVRLEVRGLRGWWRRGDSCAAHDRWVMAKVVGQPAAFAGTSNCHLCFATERPPPCPPPPATNSASCDSTRRTSRSSAGPSRFGTWKARGTSCGRRPSPRADRKDHAGTRGGRDGDTSSSTAQTRSTVRSNEAGPPSVARGTQQSGRREVGHGTGGGWELWLRVVCHTGRQNIKQTRLEPGVGTSRRVGRGTGLGLGGCRGRTGLE